MLFEGAEKKLEITTMPGTNLCALLPQASVKDLVALAGAKILSTLAQPEAQAYLLSESSLFVWPSRLLVIICGRTKMVPLVKGVVKKIGVSNIKGLMYERKNEYFPYRQKSLFYEDAAQIDRLFAGASGSAWQFGPTSEHHLFLYHLNKKFPFDAKDRTFELLMYGLKMVSTTSRYKQMVKQLKAFFAKYIGAHQVHEHIFNPAGFSLNALKGRWYYTLHITPDLYCPYVSFETNVFIKTQSEWLRLLALFNPGSFDFVTFKPTPKNNQRNNQRNQKIPSPMPLRQFKGFNLKNTFYKKLSCGFDVQWMHFYAPAKTPLKPLKLDCKKIVTLLKKGD